MSVSPAPPLLLASTSPQRPAILSQLGIPFEVAAPMFDEHDDPGADPRELVLAHARGKALSVAEGAGDRPVLGVDTTVCLDGRVYGKPAGPDEAVAMLEQLAGRTHSVVSGICVLTPGWEEIGVEETSVRFRPLTARDLGHYVASGEWRGRAGGYAIQGLGGALVERIEGDYLNVVGLPGALLVSILAQRFAGVYGFG